MIINSAKLTAKTKGVINGIIQDSLEQVVINCQNGKASQFYRVGDHVPIKLTGIGTFYFDYLGSGLDVRSDGQNKPVSTWLCRTVPAECQWSTYNETSGEWMSSKIRNYCRTTIYNSLPEVIKNNIVDVNKESNSTIINSSVITVDNVWVPSSEEINGSNCLYKTRFPDDNSRNKTGIDRIWWLRTSFSDNYAYCIFLGGDWGFNYIYNTSGVVPGFCL